MKRVSIIALSLLYAGSASAQKSCPRIDSGADWYRAQRSRYDDSKHDWTNDSLRTALLAAAPSAKSFAPQLGWQKLGAAPASGDTGSITALRALLADMAKKRSWPMRSTVGAAGVHAVWLIVRDDSTSSALGLHRMMEAGPDESSATDVAMLEDLVRMRAGRKQLYGTVLVAGDGSVKWMPAPIEDAAHVDLRRNAAGLPPLAVALCAAGARAH